MKKLVLGLAISCAVFSVGALASGVGVVDMKAIFSQSSQVKEIKASLTKQFEPQKEKLQKMSTALQADVAKYQKNKEVMNKKELTALETSITKQETAFRDAQTQFQQDVFNAQNKSLEKFMNSVKASVKIVAEKNKLDLVIPSNDVLYTKGDKDITKAVMKDMK
ncbi:MAG: hypothetical protein COY58_06630 [Gammaproteobacteria bacterium CG_4_10_14_0_8_um_filter_38_16]|nr:MAG: hypothetical protein COY58_06630 [Gammaproteobacteria bacterium CG_4_10_14_0_8_um_filter_38_16]PJA02664.1 MAG: hypothetical protein COX72_09470 [Gammaproteobacteria bacterium CG_4_10_14_0_2_um_filter_38_22]PJB09868.1 MAG: hypothetical protein CO120_07825 [Gammaproteobacteria bacterium CG_4_9_14_3_um_filter_38_9]